MHNGYPMMGDIEAAEQAVNLDGVMKNGIWGITHEIGHNHQWKSWTTAKTTETSCNWFALYVHQQVNSKKVFSNPAAFCLKNW